MNAYLEAAKLMALVERAGARHNASDNALIQQVHDVLMSLGAKCQCEPEMMTVEELRQYAPNPLLKAAVEALVLRHGTHNQKTHGNRLGVGGLREFAKARGYQIRQVKDKSGKTQFAITEPGDKRTKMRAGGLTEAKKLIATVNKRKRGAKSMERTGFDIGDVIKPKDRSGLGINNAFRSRIVGKQGKNFVVRPVNARPGSFADQKFLIPIREAIRV